MKRVAADSVDMEGNNDFPITVLRVLEKYLSDEDLTSFSQCCRKHMALCYARAERLFRWGRKQYCLEVVERFIFPSTQFCRCSWPRFSSSLPMSKRLSWSRRYGQHKPILQMWVLVKTFWICFRFKYPSIVARAVYDRRLLCRWA
jgi:hypothetical protein